MLAEDASDETYKEVIEASLYKAYCDGVILKNRYLSFASDEKFLETKSAYSALIPQHYSLTLFISA